MQHNTRASGTQACAGAPAKQKQKENPQKNRHSNSTGDGIIAGREQTTRPKTAHEKGPVTAVAEERDRPPPPLPTVKQKQGLRRDRGTRVWSQTR